jgi:glycosyltransferase involved in cell wall biosynthesis
MSGADTVVFMSGPLDSGLSGGDMHALRLSDELARRGDDRVRLITPPSMRDKLPERARDVVLEVRTPFDGRLSSMPIYLAAVTLRMVRSVRLAPPSRVSIASTHFFFDVIPCALRRRRGSLVAAYVYHLVTDSDRPAGLRSWVSAGLERLSLAVLRRYGDVVFVDNPETETALLARGFAPDRIAMTRNAYDPLEPLPPRSPPAQPLVVFLGRLVEPKGVWDVLALARAMRTRAPAARVVIVGDGPLREALKDRIHNDELDNVEVVGYLEEAEKWRRLRGASLFIAPSREEGWGIAVGEALSAGLPAVVYELPAYAHFGDLPRRVPLGDSDAFTAAVIGLVTDAEALRAEAERVERGVSSLPRWQDVLDNEIDVLGAHRARGS